MLNINTFDARAGGNVLYKALAHPLAAEAIACLYASLAQSGPVALHHLGKLGGQGRGHRGVQPKSPVAAAHQNRDQWSG